MEMHKEVSTEKLRRHMALLVTDKQVTDEEQVKDEQEVDEAQFYNTTCYNNTATNDPLMMEPKSEPPDEYDTDNENIEDKRKDHTIKDNDSGVKNKVILNFYNSNKPSRVSATLTPLDKHNFANAIYPPAKVAPKFYVNAIKSVKSYKPIINLNVVKKANNTPDVNSKYVTAVNGPIILNKVLSGVSSHIPEASKLRNIPVIASTNKTGGTLNSSPPITHPIVASEPPKNAQPCISIIKSVDSQVETVSIDLNEIDNTVDSVNDINKESPVVKSILKDKSTFKIPALNNNQPKLNFRILKGSTPLPEPETKKKVKHKKYILVPKIRKSDKTYAKPEAILCTVDQIRPIIKSRSKPTRQTVESNENPTVCGGGSKDKLILNNNKNQVNVSNVAQSVAVDQGLKPILSSLDNTQAENNSQNISSTSTQYKSCAELINDFQPHSRDDLAIANSANNLPEDDDDFDPYDLSPLPSPDTTDYTPQGPILDEASGTFINASVTNLKPKKKIPTLNSLFSETVAGNKQQRIKNGKLSKLVKKFTAEDLVSEFKKVQALKETQKRQAEQKLMGDKLRRRERRTQQTVFEELTVDMNPVAKKIFWTQINARRSKHMSGNRFSHEEKTLFAAIQALSQPCYSILEKIFVMPSLKTLELYNKSLEKDKNKNRQPDLNQSEECPNQPFLIEEYQGEENRGIPQSFPESTQDDVCTEKRTMKRNAAVTKKPKGEPAKQRKKKKVDETSLAIASISDYQATEAVNSSNLILLSDLQDVGSYEYVHSTSDALERETVADNRLADASDIWITHGEAGSLPQLEHTGEPIVKHSKTLISRKSNKLPNESRYADEFGKYLKKNVEVTGRPRSSV